MSARIIPFKRPEPKPAPTAEICSGPLVHIIDRPNAIFWGTKEQLIAWGVLVEEMLPIPPKRRNYSAPHPHGGSASVLGHRKGLFSVHFCAYRREDADKAAWIDRTAQRVRASHNDRLRTTSALLTVMHGWACSMPTDARSNDAWESLRKARSTFELSAIEMAFLPPDETEPEHAQ